MADGTYKRALGQIELVSLGIGGTIGSGIFVVPGIAAGIMGPASLIAWVIVAISATLVMVSLAWASARFGMGGTFFAIYRSVFGKKVSTVLVVLYLASCILGVATVAAGIGLYLSYFGVAHLIIIEIAVVAAFCCINLVGVSASGHIENILTVLKILPLVIIILVLVPFIRPENLAPTVPFTFMGLFATVIIVYWPFTGFEISAIPVEEMRDPHAAARSLGIVMVTVTAIYLLLNLALIGSAGSPALSGSPAPIATAIGFLFPHAGYLVAFIGIFAMLSAMNAYLVASSRVLHTLACELSIGGLSCLNRNGTPGVALVSCCAATVVMLFFSNSFSTLAVLTVVATLIPYIFFCIAAFLMFHEPRKRVVSCLGAGMTAAILGLYFFFH
jgi:amino acid transporter